MPFFHSWAFPAALTVLGLLFVILVVWYDFRRNGFNAGLTAFLLGSVWLAVMLTVWVMFFIYHL